MHVEPSMLFSAVRFRRLGCQLSAAAISQIWRPFPCHRTSDGTRISSQIGRSFLFDLSRLSAKCVPSPSRKSSSASTRPASVLRFVSLAFPSFHHFVWCANCISMLASCLLHFSHERRLPKKFTAPTPDRLWEAAVPPRTIRLCGCRTQFVNQAVA